MLAEARRQAATRPRSHKSSRVEDLDDRRHGLGRALVFLVMGLHFLSAFQAIDVERELKVPRSDVLSERKDAMQAESTALFIRMKDLTVKPHGGATVAATQTLSSTATGSEGYY